MNAAVQPTGRILLTGVRLSFAQGLFEAQTIAGSDPGAKPKYNCGLLIDPADPQIKLIEKKMLAVAREKWKDKGDGMYKALEKKDRLALHDGDGKPNYQGYPGNMFLSPSSDECKPPTLIITIDGANKTIDDFKLGDPERKMFERLLRQKLYSGAYVNASIELWAQDNQYGQRVNAQLRGVQFLRDGDSFGGGGSTASADEFGAVDTDASGVDDIA